ncbi:LIM-domain binding protein/SEUSS [Dillenia turbinata]|uniref:LIM-domain binding protein/SEUSS n=1 Tax=Dillenia turbinata TaxID=194707 RepID=A0AAN8ZEP8_9MAGN
MFPVLMFHAAAFEVLPRIIKVNFDSSVKSENMFFDNPLVYIHPSREKVLLYCKVVQETVYERFRVFHEGKLRVVFSGDLKVLSEYSDMLVTAGKHFLKELNLNKLVDEFGFNTKIVRFLQMAEVLSTMEGLMIVSKFNDMGPIGCYEKLSSRIGNLSSPAAPDPSPSSCVEGSTEIGEEKIVLADLHEKLLEYSEESDSPIMYESTLVANVNPSQRQSASGSGLSTSTCYLPLMRP